MSIIDKTNVENNAWLCFANGQNIPVFAEGKTGTFDGYLSIIDGVFSLRELQFNNTGACIFATNIVDLSTLQTSKSNHLTIIAPNFIHHNKNDLREKNITIISNTNLRDISYALQNDDNYNSLNNIKCVIYF